jgi:hypothetical protein
MCRLFCVDLLEQVLVKYYDRDRANEVLVMDWSLDYFTVLFPLHSCEGYYQIISALPLYSGVTRFEILSGDRKSWLVIS